MLFDGKAAAAEISLQCKQVVTEKKVLGVFGIGLDAVSQAYVTRKQKFGTEIGHELRVLDIPDSTLLDEVGRLFSDFQASVDAVIIQLPLARPEFQSELFALIDPKKDVDDLTRTHTYSSPIVRSVLRAVGREIVASERVCIIGNGVLVGQPMYEVVRNIGAQVEIFDAGSDRIIMEAALRAASIIITGTGSSHLITPAMISEGAILIDTGTSYLDGVLCGDCHPDCAQKAAIMTPTPGGIGPMVVAYLWANVLGI